MSRGVCVIDGCERNRVAKGICNTHYHRLIRTGTTDPSPKAAAQQAKWAGATCKANDCGREIESRGLCGMHYMRWLRTGGTERTLRLPAETPEESAARRKEWKRTHYQRHKEEIKARVRRYARENRDKIKRRSAAYYRANKKAHRERFRAMYAEKGAEIRARVREYREANPGKVRAWNADRRARVRDAEGTMPPGTVKRLLKRQKHRCVACRADLRETGYHLDHRTPLARGGTNRPSNAQLLCPPCNFSKGARDPVEFMQEKGWLL